MHPPGWYHGPGDPPDTLRYWDGTGWVGPATPAAQRQTAGGYDLIPPVEYAPELQINQAIAQSQPGQPLATTAPTKRYAGNKMDRFISTGVVFLVLGLIFGVAVQNMVTYFSTPTEVAGIVSETSVTRGRRGRTTLRAEITTDVGTFYASGRTRSFFATTGQRVTVAYSATTGGLVAIKELGIDRQTVGQILWPTVALAALLGMFIKLYIEVHLYRDWLKYVFILIFLVIAPLLSIPLGDAFDQILTRVFDWT